MEKLVLDEHLRAKLADVQTPLELCDQSGRTLGFFHPLLDALACAMKAPRLTAEEAVRLCQQRTGRPLADILADLEKRPA